jgi:hypothetical protein
MVRCRRHVRYICVDKPPFDVVWKPSLTLRRIDVPRRLRRAIVLNDLPLVQRIVRNNPDYLRNTDYQEKSNTNLHLAAKLGFTQIAVRRTLLRAYVTSRPMLRFRHLALRRSECIDSR